MAAREEGGNRAGRWVLVLVAELLEPEARAPSSEHGVMQSGGEPDHRTAEGEEPEIGTCESVVTRDATEIFGSKRSDPRRAPNSPLDLFLSCFLLLPLRPARARAHAPPCLGPHPSSLAPPTPPSPAALSLPCLQLRRA